jgi:hypothetical protein
MGVLNEHTLALAASTGRETPPGRLFFGSKNAAVGRVSTRRRGRAGRGGRRGRGVGGVV